MVDLTDVIEQLETLEPNATHTHGKSQGQVVSTYIDDNNKIRRKVRTYCTEPTRTEQGHQTDINRLLDTYDREDLLRRFSAWRDVNNDGVIDVHSYEWKDALDVVKRGETVWASLDASVRRKFKSPLEMLRFVEDDKNYDEAVKIGLIAKKAEPVIPDPAPAPDPAPNP